MIESKQQLEILAAMRKLDASCGYVTIDQLRQAQPHLFTSAWCANNTYSAIRALNRKGFVKCVGRARYRITPVNELPEYKPQAKTQAINREWDHQFAREWLARPWRAA